MSEIQFDTVGIIRKGQNPGWFIKVETTTADRYLVSFWNKDEHFYNWADSKRELENFFSDKSWDVDWEQPV
ncbi:MAG TPA: hypothetical protein PK358_01940 [Spirochaetota bacterium]|nr:hypothetical protein [Spirochaetota bacterium]HPJ33565.1 hypothetical protein [Spirochaetota bacterium]